MVGYIRGGNVGWRWGVAGRGLWPVGVGFADVLPFPAFRRVLGCDWRRHCSCGQASVTDQDDDDSNLPMNTSADVRLIQRWLACGVSTSCGAWKNDGWVWVVSCVVCVHMHDLTE
jgi:hypothetical protein